jgi:hypothetical protein
MKATAQRFRSYPGAPNAAGLRAAVGAAQGICGRACESCEERAGPIVQRPCRVSFSRFDAAAMDRVRHVCTSERVRVRGVAAVDCHP